MKYKFICGCDVNSIMFISPVGEDGYIDTLIPVPTELIGSGRCKICGQIIEIVTKDSKKEELR